MLSIDRVDVDVDVDLSIQNIAISTFFFNVEEIVLIKLNCFEDL